jgi:dTDP-4-dehydrorhamnose 3,5-epimerase
MRFLEAPLAGVYCVDVEPREDDRGFFARAWCAREFEKRGLAAQMSQCNITFSRRKGTLRGLHYQAAPHEEAKLVRCTAGASYHVAVDLRPQSATFKQWHGVELTAANHRMLYVPEGFAHGAQALADDTELFYQMTVPYHEASARIVRWNDPAFGVRWPIAKPTLSDRDRDAPDFAR